MLGEDAVEDEAFVAKVFSDEATATSWADTQNATQANILYSVHERWVDAGLEFVSE